MVAARLKYNELVAQFAFNFNLRRYIEKDAARAVDHELMSRLNFPERFPEYIQLMGGGGTASSFGGTEEAALAVAVDHMLLSKLNFPAANYRQMASRLITSLTKVGRCRSRGAGSQYQNPC